jgi:hypothetical protein
MAQTPDVRVRLSAEGVQEVVNAFKRIQTEAEKSSKGAGRAMNFLSDQAAALGRLLPTLSFAAVAAGATVLTRRALENADALGKLEQKTGLTVETLSTFSFAARTADLDQEQLRTTLIKFTKATDDYDQGLRNARDAVEQLFGSSKALEGLDQDTRLLKVVDALGKLEPGAKRTGLAIEFFGRQGAELLPLIDDLADGGFENLRQKAEKLGLVVNRDLADASRSAKDALTNIGSTVEGVATQFAAGFAPAIADVANALVEAATGDGFNAFRMLGDFAGKVLKGIIVLITAVGAGIVKIIGRTVSLIVNAGRLVANVLQGNIRQGWEAFKNGIVADADNLDKSIDERVTRIFQALSGQNREQEAQLRRARGARKREISADLQDRERNAKAERALQEQLLENELNLLKANLKAQTAEEKRRFEEGLIGLQEFFANRRSIIEQEAQKEIEVLEKRLQFESTRPLAKTETEADRQKNIAEIQNQIAIRRIELEEQLADLAAEERKATRDLQKEQTAFEVKLAELQGNRFAAARAALDEESRKLDEILRKQGVADAERARRVQEFRAAGEAQINFDEILAQGRQALAQLEADRRDIELQVQQGILFQFQGEQQIVALEQERLPLLRQIAQQLLAAAEAIGDPEKITQAREFAQSIEAMSLSSNRAAKEMAQFKAAVDQSLTSNLQNFFAQGIENAESFADAMRQLALSVVDSLRQIAAQMLANLAIQKLLGAFGGFGLFSQGGVVKAAGGGLIRGPGTGTSDSIPARLSDHEFVVRAAVVRQPGVLELLEELNAEGSLVLRRRGLRGFSEGGLVEVGSTDSGTGRADLMISLDETLLLKRLEASPMFARVIVRTMEDNRKAVNNALGRGVQ